MVGVPQGELVTDERILRTPASEWDPVLGRQASVVHGGRVRVGDRARLR